MSAEFTETRRDLINRAAAPDVRVRVTRNQLIRWHRAGLLPRPRRKGLGRGRGVESYYPAGTAEQLAALVRAKKRSRSLTDVGWYLWLDGYPVEGFIRSDIVTRLSENEAEIRDNLARFRAAENQDSGPNFNNPIHQAKGGPDESSLVRFLHELLAGEAFSDTDTDGVESQPVDPLTLEAQERDAADRLRIIGKISQQMMTDGGVQFEPPLGMETVVSIWKTIAEAFDLASMRTHVESLDDVELRRMRHRARLIQERWGSHDMKAIRRTFVFDLRFQRVGIDLVGMLEVLEAFPFLEFMLELLRDLTQKGRYRAKRRTMQTVRLPEDLDAPLDLGRIHHDS